MEYKIIHFKTITSTNDYALALAREGAKEWTVVIADYQTRGRGRYARKWVSPRDKDLLFSIIVSPKLKARYAPILTHLAAKSVKEALKEKLNLKTKIKPPNDLISRNKKLCGILVEGSSQEQIVEFAVIGIGLNVNSSTKELIATATSIYEEIKRKIEKKPLFYSILEKFDEKYSKIINKKLIS